MKVLDLQGDVSLPVLPGLSVRPVHSPVLRMTVVLVQTWSSHGSGTTETLMWVLQNPGGGGKRAPFVMGKSQLRPKSLSSFSAVHLSSRLQNQG